MATHSGIIWECGDILRRAFFTRDEFEEFSVQGNLYDILLEKEKELHPAGPLSVSCSDVVSAKTETVVKTESTVESVPLQTTVPIQTIHKLPEKSAPHLGGPSLQKNEPIPSNSSEQPDTATGEEHFMEGNDQIGAHPTPVVVSTDKKAPLWMLPEDDKVETVSVPTSVAAGRKKAVAAQCSWWPKHPYPRPSWLTMEEQKFYLEYSEKHKGAPVSTKTAEEQQQFQRFKEIQQKVAAEQEEFMMYSEQYATNFPESYRHINYEADKFVSDYISGQCERVLNYARYYVQQDSVHLCSKQHCFVPFVHLKCLLELGAVPRAVMPHMETFKRPHLPLSYNKLTQRFPVNMDHQRKPTVSQDENSEKLALKYAAEVVISASGLKCLLDQGTAFERQWELPVCVRKHVIKDERGDRTQKVVYIDKPFPARTLLTSQKNAWYHKLAMRSVIQHPKHNRLHIFSKRKTQPQTGEHGHSKSASVRHKESSSLFDEPGIPDLDNLETFGTVSKVGESRPSAFRKYVRPEPPDVILNEPESEGSSSTEGEEEGGEDETNKHEVAETDALKGRRLLRPGSQGFIVGIPTETEHVSGIPTETVETPSPSVQTEKPTRVESKTTSIEGDQDNESLVMQVQSSPLPLTEDRSVNDEAAQHTSHQGQSTDVIAEVAVVAPDETSIDRRSPSNLDKSDKDILKSPTLSSTKTDQNIQEMKNTKNEGDDQGSSGIKETAGREMQPSKGQVRCSPRTTLRGMSSQSKAPGVGKASAEERRTQGLAVARAGVEHESLGSSTTTDEDSESDRLMIDLSDDPTPVGPRRSSRQAPKRQVSQSSSTAEVPPPPLPPTGVPPRRSSRRISSTECTSPVKASSEVLSSVDSEPETSTSHQYTETKVTRTLQKVMRPLCGRWRKEDSGSLRLSTESAHGSDKEKDIEEEPVSKRVTRSQTVLRSTGVKKRSTASDSDSCHEEQIVSPPKKQRSSDEATPDITTTPAAPISSQVAPLKPKLTIMRELQDLPDTPLSPPVQTPSSGIGWQQRDIPTIPISPQVNTFRQESMPQNQTMPQLSVNQLLRSDLQNVPQTQGSNLIGNDEPVDPNRNSNPIAVSLPQVKQEAVVKKELKDIPVSAASKPSGEASSEQTLVTGSCPTRSKMSKPQVSNVITAEHSTKTSSSDLSMSTLDEILEAQTRLYQHPTVKVDSVEETHAEVESLEAVQAKPPAPTSANLSSLKREPVESPDDYEHYDQHNLTYNLWLLGNVRLIVRCGVHGVVRNKKKNQFVSLSAKMEHQPFFGVEQVTPGELARSWVDLHIRNVPKLCRMRVNALTSEVMKIDQLTIGDVVNTRSPFNPMNAASSLYVILDKLKSLPVGDYLLGHSPGNIQAHIKKSVTTTSGVYDLHKAYLATRVGVINDSHTPWRPIDASVQLFFHVKFNRVPATFEPKDSPNLAAATAGFRGHRTVRVASKNKKRKKSGKKK